MDQDQLKLLLQDIYGLQCDEVKSLYGYDTSNYLVISGPKKYILKAYPFSQEVMFDLEAEHEVLQHITDFDLDLPEMLDTVSGDYLYHHDQSEQIFRLLTFVNGDLWSSLTPERRRIDQLGQALGRLDRQLARLIVPSIKARHLTWDVKNFLELKEWISYINDAADRSIVHYFFNQWVTQVSPKLPGLPQSLIYNDANGNNLLCTEGQLSGMIDFGDMVYTYRVNEVAVSATYIAMDSVDSVSDIATLIKHYHQEYPLTKGEIDLMYYFIAARICTSILHSSKSSHLQPDNDYAQEDSARAWTLLKKWLGINPLYCKNQWRSAAGYDEIIQDQHLRKRRAKYLPTAYSLSYEEPIHMIGAAYQYMYDASGNTILDAYNNIIQVGHCHPRVVEAGQRALATLNTNTRYLYDIHATYSEHLLSYFPEHINQLFLVNSGSAASDLAIRLANVYTGRSEIAVIKHGYHGNTRSTINISHYKYAHKGGAGKSSNVIELDLPDTYNGSHQGESGGSAYINSAISALDAAEHLAAFIAEPIVGCGGQVPLPPGYLQQVYEKVRSKGGVCISDEVQTGFGRVGDGFWGYELHGVCPDIIVMGKPMGNGHPIGAVATTTVIAEAFDNGMEFFSSFGGNPVSCAIGAAVLQVIEEEELMHNAKSTGAALRSHISEVQAEVDCIGDIRGNGLFLGIEIVKHLTNKTPDAQRARAIINSLRVQNILTSLDGPHHNVIKVKPPLQFDKQNAAYLAERLHKILRQL